MNVLHHHVFVLKDFLFGFRFNLNEFRFFS